MKYKKQAMLNRIWPASDAVPFVKEAGATGVTALRLYVTTLTHCSAVTLSDLDVTYCRLSPPDQLSLAGSKSSRRWICYG